MKRNEAEKDQAATDNRAAASGQSGREEGQTVSSGPWYTTKRFWIIATLIVVFASFFLIGGNIVQCFRLRRDIRNLNTQIEAYRIKIERDSMMLENLKYDDFIEAYAREHYSLQRRNETVYIMDE